MNGRTRRVLRWAILTAVALLLVHAARSVEWSETWRAIRSASPALLIAAAVVNLASLLARGVRWWIFLRRAGAPSMAAALRGAVVGSGLNNVIPASGGEAARVVLVARHAGVSTASVLAALALDRLVELLSCVALLVAAPLVVPLPAALARWRVHAAVALAILVGVCAALAWRAARISRAARSGGLMDGDAGTGAAPDPARSAGRVRLYTSRFVSALTGLPTARRLSAALALSLLSWIGQAVAYHLTAQAVGFPASPLASTASMLAVNVTFVLQVTPGNVGIFQLVYALVMSAFGLSHNAAVGVALLIQAVQIVPVTILALALAPRLVVGRLRHHHTAPETPTAP